MIAGTAHPDVLYCRTNPLVYSEVHGTLGELFLAYVAYSVNHADLSNFVPLLVQVCSHLLKGKVATQTYSAPQAHLKEFDFIGCFGL